MDARIRQLPNGKWKLHGRAGGRQYARTLMDEETAQTYLGAVPLHGLAAVCRMIDEHRNPNAVDDGLSVEEVVREFIAKNIKLSPETRLDYLGNAEVGIFPFIGSVPATTLTKQKVEDWMIELKAKGQYAVSTVKSRRMLLAAAYAWAMDRDDMGITKNPVRGAALPPGESRSMICLEPHEVETMLSVVDPHYHDFVLTLASTGMRYGEATALGVGDIKFRPGHAVINVDKAWQRTHSGRSIMGDCKTAQSKRQIRIPHGTDVYDALVRCTTGRRTDELLFTNKGGKQIINAVFHRDVWAPLRKALMHQHGWTKMPRIHDLRHTAASIMIHNGVPINAVSAVLGHATVVMTLNTYTHLLSGATDAATAVLGKALTFNKKEERAA